MENELKGGRGSFRTLESEAVVRGGSAWGDKRKKKLPATALSSSSSSSTYLKCHTAEAGHRSERRKRGNK